MGPIVCLGLRLHVPFWCSFRDPSSSNVHRTFPVPPPSTLYGIIAAALGLRADDQSYRSALRFAIAIENQGETVETYSKWMKGAEGSPKDDKQRTGWAAMKLRGLLAPDEAVWISTPLIRQKILQPTFVVGVLCESEIARVVQQALMDPMFPLCIGENDDVVDIDILGVDEPVVTSSPATGTVSGVAPGGILANLPTRFTQTDKGKWSLERWLVTIPRPNVPVAVDNSELFACHGHVWSYEPPTPSNQSM